MSNRKLGDQMEDLSQRKEKTVAKQTRKRQHHPANLNIIFRPTTDRNTVQSRFVILSALNRRHDNQDGNHDPWIA